MALTPHHAGMEVFVSDHLVIALAVIVLHNMKERSVKPVSDQYNRHILGLYSSVNWKME